MVASLACQLRSRRARPLARIVLCPGVSCVPFALAPTCWLVWAVRWGGDQFDGMNSVVLLSLSLAVLASGAGVRAALVARNVWSFFFPFFSLLLFFCPVSFGLPCVRVAALAAFPMACPSTYGIFYL